MKLSPTLLHLAATTLLPAVRAWGSIGHETVAFVAAQFVTPDTEQFLQSVLGDGSPAYLASVATWADTWRFTPEGRFSRSFHFIDAMDDPPAQCGVSFERDCGYDGCIVGAIRNYTERVMDAGLHPRERAIAAKLLVHFFGDIHQPLHIEHLERGLNGVPVVVFGHTTNLHAAWDRYMIEQFLAPTGDSLETAQVWSAVLSNEIVRGAYAPAAGGWLAGLDVHDPVASSLIWAAEANQYICSTVIPQGEQVLVNQTLDGDYYEAAIPVIQLQVARAGYRLAAWLNAIAAGMKTEL